MPSLNVFAEGLSIADTHYQDEAGIIGCGVIDTPEGYLLVDPGPDPSIPNLLDVLGSAGIGLADVYGILLTHIHLDHAGGTGTLLAEKPSLKVWVHERGAAHMIDPERLLHSAGRIYGDQMDRLWGRFLPIPEEKVTVIDQRTWLDFGGRKILAEPTPGHASHHLAFLDDRTGTAFAGDVAGIRMEKTDYVMPVAPPPDIDVDAWNRSIDLLRGWNPDCIVPTHFGPYTDAEHQLAALEKELGTWSEWIRSKMDTLAKDEMLATFDALVCETMPEKVIHMGDDAYHPYGQVEASLNGIMRYWRKKNLESRVGNRE